MINDSAMTAERLAEIRKRVDNGHYWGHDIELLLADRTKLAADLARVEGERDALKSDRARSISRGRILIRVRDALINIKEGIESEVDRTYFGSMNDADMFCKIVDELDAFKWDRIMAEKPEPDVIEECRKANERALAAEARLAQANEALNAGPFTLHRQGDDCMSPGGCRFSIFDGEGNVWAMFDTLPIDDRRKAQSIVGALNATPTPPAQSAGEALDPAGTGEGVEEDLSRVESYCGSVYPAWGPSWETTLAIRRLAALIRAQAIALAEAQRNALEEAAKEIDKHPDASGSRYIRALTEPQHG